MADRDTASVEGVSAGRRGGVVLWVGLAAALSPVLADLLRHIVAEPWTRYSLVFAPLLALRVVRDPGVAPARDGYLWLGLALLLELFALGGNTPGAGRPALPLAVIGLCRAFGVARLRTAALSLWLVPVPNLLVLQGSPLLERALAGAALPLLDALGSELRLEGSVAVAAGGSLELLPWDGGLPLAALLSGLGWYAGLRGGGRWGCVPSALLWGLCAFPVQALAMLLALLLLGAGAPDLARAWLGHGLWITAALTGVALAHRRPPAALPG